MVSNELLPKKKSKRTLRDKELVRRRSRSKTQRVLTSAITSDSSIKTQSNSEKRRSKRAAKGQAEEAEDSAVAVAREGVEEEVELSEEEVSSTLRSLER